MLVTVCPLTTGSHSPQWTGTTTRPPSAAPVPRPMEGDGGSTGELPLAIWDKIDSSLVTVTDQRKYLQLL